MSITNFVPTVWSARLQEHLDKGLVIAARANRSYEVDARSGTAKINQVGDIPVTSHSKGSTVTYAEPYSTQKTLTLNQRSIAGFLVDDLDAVQANINLVENYSQRMGYSLRDDIDRYTASLYSSAGAGDVAIDIVAVAASEVRDAFAEMGELLDANSVPMEGRWAIVSPKVRASMFKDTGITQATDQGDQALAAGSIGRFMGFDLFMSNNILGTGVTVTLSAAASQGDTALTVASLPGDVPAGTILTFGPGQYARVTAAASATDTSLTVATLTVDIADASTATYVQVRKCMFGTSAAITMAMNLQPDVEALRDKDTTDDYVRAEQNYGALVIEPYALGTLSATEAS